MGYKPGAAVMGGSSGKTLGGKKNNIFLFDWPLTRSHEPATSSKLKRTKWVRLIVYSIQIQLKSRPYQACDLIYLVFPYIYF